MKTWKEAVLNIKDDLSFDNRSYLLGGNELFNLDILIDSSIEEKNILIKLEDALIYD